MSRKIPLAREPELILKTEHCNGTQAREVLGLIEKDKTGDYPGAIPRGFGAGSSVPILSVMSGWEWILL